MNELDLKKLLAECQRAVSLAYCPYSRFAVGAAVQTSDGHIFTGCNIENAAYTGCICAERTAICKAVSEGYTKFTAIAITSNMSTPDLIVPCGTCRQFIREFCEELTVYLVRPDSTYVETSLQKLLPMSFGPQDLAKGVQK